MRSFRESHAWLRGYSDGLAGKEPVNVAWVEYTESYGKGWVSGRTRYSA